MGNGYFESKEIVPTLIVISVLLALVLFAQSYFYLHTYIGVFYAFLLYVIYICSLLYPFVLLINKCKTNRIGIKGMIWIFFLFALLGLGGIIGVLRGLGK